jgi:hypothetical protein
MPTRADVLDRSRPLWRKDEFAQILTMLLAEDLVALVCDEQLGMAKREPVCRRLVNEAQPPCRTLGDLLAHPAPPMQLLIWAKDWAKVQRDRQDVDVPVQVALALYYAVIAAADLRAGQRITSMDDERLSGGHDWAFKQPWLDEATRKLFGAALAKLRPGKPA